MNKPLISIITVVYNDKIGLECTAKSVIQQTAFSKTEWIIIDADSQDGTKEVLEKYKGYTSYAISEPDNGIYDGMNKGIALATGEYCIFMNAGDRFNDEYVLENIINDPSFGQFDHVSGNTYGIKQGKIVGKQISPTSISAKELYSNSLNHQSTFIRTSRLKSFGGYDTRYKIVADAKFFFEDLIMRDATYKKSDIYISIYNIEGISCTQSSKADCEKQQFLTEILPPRIYKDLKRMVEGRTIIERVLAKSKENGFIYQAIQLFGVILYSPISIRNRIRIIIKKKKDK